MRLYLPVLLLAASGMAIAQNPAAGMDGCPVGLSARQQATAPSMWTIAQEDAHRIPLGPSRSGVHVELNGNKGKAIQQVELRVHYLSEDTRVMTIAPGPATPDATLSGSDSTKTYTLATADGNSLKLTAELLVGPASTLRSVSVSSIRYADGSSWQTSAKQRCSVPVDHLILVNNH